MAIKLPFTKEKIKNEHIQIREYFNKCSDDIERQNRFMLRKSCMYISTVCIAMIIIAEQVVPYFHPSTAHLLLIPLLGGYFAFNLYTRKRENLPHMLTRILCLIFYFLVFMVFIYRDMTSGPGSPALWFPLYLVAFPTVYIDRIYMYAVEESILLVIYCLCSYTVKPEILFRHDVYAGIAACVVSLLSANIILNVRSQEGLAKAELAEISTIDRLTLLLNKCAFLQALDTYFSRRKKGEPCAMCVIDVDDFKHVNDNFGHNLGDKLLSNIGELLRESFRSSDIIGRFGGDEFIVFMPNMDQQELVEMRCHNMQSMLSKLNLGDHDPFSLSIGCIIDKGDHPSNKLFRLADDALYESKLLGKNRCTAWTVYHREPTGQPLMLFVHDKDNSKSQLLVENEHDRFDIIEAYSNDTALAYLCQYHTLLTLIVVEMDMPGVSGHQVIRYVKSRTGFDKLPVLAIAQTEEGLRMAKLLKADRYLLSSEDNSTFHNAISDLTAREE